MQNNRFWSSSAVKLHGNGKDRMPFESHLLLQISNEIGWFSEFRSRILCQARRRLVQYTQLPEI